MKKNTKSPSTKWFKIQLQSGAAGKLQNGAKKLQSGGEITNDAK